MSRNKFDDNDEENFGMESERTTGDSIKKLIKRLSHEASISESVSNNNIKNYSTDRQPVGRITDGIRIIIPPIKIPTIDDRRPLDYIDEEDGLIR